MDQSELSIGRKWTNHSSVLSSPEDPQRGGGGAPAGQQLQPQVCPLPRLGEAELAGQRGLAMAGQRGLAPRTLASEAGQQGGAVAVDRVGVRAVQPLRVGAAPIRDQYCG